MRDKIWSAGEEVETSQITGWRPSSHANGSERKVQFDVKPLVGKC